MSSWIHFTVEITYLQQFYNLYLTFNSPVDKLLSSEDGGGIFDDPPAITESVMMPPDHGDDEDDFDNLQSRKRKPSPSCRTFICFCCILSLPNV